MVEEMADFKVRIVKMETMIEDNVLFCRKNENVDGYSNEIDQDKETIIEIEDKRTTEEEKISAKIDVANSGAVEVPGAKVHGVAEKKKIVTHHVITDQNNNEDDVVDVKDKAAPVEFDKKPEEPIEDASEVSFNFVSLKPKLVKKINYKDV